MGDSGAGGMDPRFKDALAVSYLANATENPEYLSRSLPFLEKVMTGDAANGGQLSPQMRDQISRFKDAFRKDPDGFMERLADDDVGNLSRLVTLSAKLTSGGGELSPEDQELVNMAQDAGKRFAWKKFKENPLENGPKVMGLWLRSKGYDGM